MIVVIDYNMGNIGSVFNMLKKVGAEVIVSSDIADIERATKLILPGVGSFDNGMQNLNKLGIIPLLNKKILNDKTPILGICLGLQLFTQKSEEGNLSGLGWINAKTIRFKFDNINFKIPHMGWNDIKLAKEGILLKEMYLEPRFYFVHSYHVVCNDSSDILTWTHYGYDFVSSIQRENIMGVQFHPEKSHKFGMKLLKNFVEYL